MTAPGAARLTFLPDILEEHLDELESLLALRDVVLRAADARRRNLRDVDQRVLAHLGGVLAIGQRAQSALSQRLASDAPGSVEAAACSLLAAGTEWATAMLLEKWSAAEGSALIAIGAALRRVVHPDVLSRLASVAGSGSALRQAVSARAIVRHGSWRPAPGVLQAVIHDPDPVVRHEAWLLVRDSGVVLDPRSYAAALRDDAAAVRDTSLLAAAWTRVQGALSVARQKGHAPSRDAATPLRVLAALGERQDIRAIGAMGENAELGALRFELLGLFGHPGHMALILDAMGGVDPRSAIAAGLAFSRMTGVDVTTTERVFFPHEDEEGGTNADPNFEAEFQDEGLLPDAARAREAWARLEPALGGAVRIADGRDVTAPGEPPSTVDPDMASWWWQLVRARFWNASEVTIADVETFPAR